MASHRYHTPRQKAAIVAFYKEHGYQATQRRYKLGSGTIYGWLRAEGSKPRNPGGERRGPSKGTRRLNGQSAALIHLTRYAQRIQLPPSDQDLDVLLAIRALQGKS